VITEGLVYLPGTSGFTVSSALWSLSTAALLRRFPRIIYNRAGEYINLLDSIYSEHKTIEMMGDPEDMTTSIDQIE
jgi:hypothetical protein